MLNTQLINQVVEWERRLAYQAEQQKFHPRAPYVNYLAPVTSPVKPLPVESSSPELEMAQPGTSAASPMASQRMAPQSASRLASPCPQPCAQPTPGD